MIHPRTVHTGPLGLYCSVPVDLPADRTAGTADLPDILVTLSRRYTKTRSLTAFQTGENFTKT